eukprot:266775-Amphidinium_carterae.1
MDNLMIRTPPAPTVLVMQTLVSHSGDAKPMVRNTSDIKHVGVLPTHLQGRALERAELHSWP